MIHLQRGHAHVAAVDEGQQVAEHEKWHEPPDHLAQGLFFKISYISDASLLHTGLRMPMGALYGPSEAKSVVERQGITQASCRGFRGQEERQSQRP